MVYQVVTDGQRSKVAQLITVDALKCRNRRTCNAAAKMALSELTRRVRDREGRVLRLGKRRLQGYRHAPINTSTARWRFTFQVCRSTTTISAFGDRSVCTPAPTAARSCC